MKKTNSNPTKTTFGTRKPGRAIKRIRAKHKTKKR